jgi:hypothetical protein
VDPRADLDEAEKRKLLTIAGLELRPLDRQARSQSLYRLRYPGSWYSDWLRAMVFEVSHRSKKVNCGHDSSGTREPGITGLVRASRNSLVWTAQ